MVIAVLVFGRNDYKSMIAVLVGYFDAPHKNTEHARELVLKI